MENITGSWDGLQNENINCEDLTNNGLYMIFIGYVLPLLSPKLRNYGKEFLCSLKNAGKVAGNLVSLTEYGFEKVQGLKNNAEMIDFITELSDKREYKLLTTQISDLAWKFSGDTDNGKKEGLTQTWKRLDEEIDKLLIKNKIIKTMKP